MKNFAIIGVAGYIAPRHLKAIRETGNDLVSAYDKNDSVGIIDSYFPKAYFCTEQELFDRHNNWFISQGNHIDYLTVCSPNYLHDAHTRYGLRLGCDVICEKPVVLSPWNIDALEQMEQETGHKAYTIFQLRLHPSVVALKKKIEEGREAVNARDADKVREKVKALDDEWFPIVQKIYSEQQAQQPGPQQEPDGPDEQ